MKIKTKMKNDRIKYNCQFNLSMKTIDLVFTQIFATTVSNVFKVLKTSAWSCVLVPGTLWGAQ